VINQRKKHLSKLRGQLLAPQPRTKKVKRFPKSSTDFQPGDVAVFKPEGGRPVRFGVLHIWGDRGGTYADICLLGIDNGKPFKKTTLSLKDTLGPHFTMLGHEPIDRITFLRRGVGLPERNSKTTGAWIKLALSGMPGHACTWEDFPSALKTVFKKLGW
jgi:hypothetical protein